MPKIVVVTDQPDLAALTESLLKARTSARLRGVAAERIRAANPTVDLDHLTPGRILVIPTLDGELSRARDRVELELDAAAAVLSEVVDGNAKALESRAADVAATRKLFGSAAVKRVAEENEALGEAISAWREGVAGQEDAARRGAEAFKAAVSTWSEDLQTLRDLAEGGV